MKLSIIIPVFNEEKTILEILNSVLEIKIPGVIIEVITVDDGSIDGTSSKLKTRAAGIAFGDARQNSKFKNLTVITHEKNQGKGAAVKTGINKATGDYILIQDADLEYNPKDILRLVDQIKTNKSQVVYGTRLNRLPNFSKDEKKPLFLIHFLGNRFLSLITSVLYGQWITDMETCYKLFPAKAVKSMNLHAKSFDFEPEITAKLLKSGYRILEIPITTKPRSYEEGKKLNTIRDGTIALWTLLKYRFID